MGKLSSHVPRYVQIDFKVLFVFVRKGQVFYFRFPLNRLQLDTMVDVVVSETTSGSAPGLPEWLELRRDTDRLEFIGLPTAEHRRMHFFHMKLIKSK